MSLPVVRLQYVTFWQSMLLDSAPNGLSPRSAVVSVMDVSFHVCCVMREALSAMLTFRVLGNLLAVRHQYRYRRTQTILGRANKG